ncbi:MAG: ATP-binding cassette domain-containing protein [Comamonadaceae bacterium]|nr:ATP-binding cassette domain-containing protein [Comamonadaceae bacterium]
MDGIDFTVHEGEVFGFLGPNGAGKTSTIRMLTGLSRPTAGTAHLLGLDLEQRPAAHQETHWRCAGSIQPV